MHYFAYVTRRPDGLYCADLIDLPGCSVQAKRLTLLDEAVVEAVRAFIAGRTQPLPKPTQLAELPRAEEDGYWMAFDVGVAVKRLPSAGDASS